MQDETGMMSCLLSLSDIFLSLQNLSVKYLSLESWYRELSPGTHIVGGLQSLSRKAIRHSLSRKANVPSHGQKADGDSLTSFLVSKKQITCVEKQEP